MLFFFFLLLGTWLDLLRFTYTKGLVDRVEKSYLDENKKEDIYVIYWIGEKNHTFNFKTTTGKYNPGNRIAVRYFRDLPDFGEFDDGSKIRAVIQSVIICGVLASASIVLSLVNRKYRPKNSGSDAST